MRCLCCNKNLSDFESTRKHAITGQYLDLCHKCFHEVSSMVDLPTEDRKDLVNFEDIEEELDNTEPLEYNVYTIEDNFDS